MAANNAHSRSESARSKNPSGIVRPMALAVFRLIASSNFVGCSIGKSFGWRPCNTLCTNLAPCRNKAGPSAPYDIKPPASTKARVVEAAGKRCSTARSAIRLVDKQRHDHIDLEPHQFGSKLGGAIQPSFGGAELVCNILPPHIAKFTHSVLEFLFE